MSYVSLKAGFERYVVPGLVIQAVIVGAGYATGRELVEFFLSEGPANGLLGMGVTALLFTVGAVISFELARLFRTFDYQSFCNIYLGRFVVLFEAGYIATLLLTLSVISAAAGELLASTFSVPRTGGSIAFMALVAFFVFFGNRAIERVISAWSIIFYITYLTLFALVLWHFGEQMAAAIDFAAIELPVALWSGVSYTGYNIVVIPILIFVARNFQSRRQAVIAGALAGPLILLPGFAFLLALSAFHPQIVSAPLPVTFILERLGIPGFAFVIQLVVFGAFIKTGAGLLHGLNERIARGLRDRQIEMPRFGRPAVAGVALIVAVYAAAEFGLIDLIGKGYRFSSYFFLLVFLLPLLTRGLWLVWAKSATTWPRGSASIEGGREAAAEVHSK
jgi:uncharacterized membrane protein YkvI